MGARRWIIAIVVVLGVWMGGYAFLTRSPDATAYREMCVQSAQSALDGLATARLANDDGLLPPFRKSLNDDAQKLVEQARSQLTAAAPPDQASARRRDTLVPLLDEAQRAATTGGDQQLEAKLREFIQGNR